MKTPIQNTSLSSLLDCLIDEDTLRSGGSKPEHCLRESRSTNSTRQSRQWKRKREVVGLQWAKLVPVGPFGESKGLTRAQKEGVRFQKRRAKAYSKLAATVGGEYLDDPWIEFEDFSGPGFARPDGIFVHGDTAIVIECKLTECERAFEELRSLYLPLVREALDTEAVGVQVFKYATEPEGGLGDFLELFTKSDGIYKLQELR